MSNSDETIDTVRASRAGHTFHERWAARRALQLVFPSDDLFAIAVEGISPTETANPGARAEEVADLVLYYGAGDNFQTCSRLETVQFKYKLREEPVTAAYLRKTIEKFADTIIGYEKEFPAAKVDEKLSFTFVTNSEFAESLSAALQALIDNVVPSHPGAATQVRNLKKWCVQRGLSDAKRLFSRVAFRAGEKSLAGQDSALRRTLTDWSAGADSEARIRLHDLQDLILKKAGPSGQGKNLIHREDVLDALRCEPEDLFPADTRFIDVGAIVERAELSKVGEQLKASGPPVFLHADGGVGKTVFVQSLAAKLVNEFEVVVFDCFGGGSYRSDNHSRHLPRIGLVQIVNELASRTLCDPLLPGGDDSRKVIKAARKRLSQAATAIRHQSTKTGLLVIIDAADNAQVEADDRHEDAFPKLLLAAIDEDPIDGVRVLLTARTHRKDKVIGRATVDEVELGPFTDHEAIEFLERRKPTASGSEIAIALARSGRNARILDYLVQTWDRNVLGDTASSTITVPEIIAQQCTKIVSDLHVAGWSDAEVVEFFVAISLLPPPIPLEELASSLGWSAAQVKAAASDLAPMLEITPHGAIFRDEPTETYIRETYADRAEAQKAIADRLLSSQAVSAYAAEALPHFLVVIRDSDRAFALVDSTSFPATVTSVFGRRRLTLARLRAAFRLAVAEDDFDRTLGLSMRLAQAATANMRGDEFIRNSPAHAIVLGDADSYRRLSADRSGWRGARSARMTIAHRFAGDAEEATIQCDSTIRWINWHSRQSQDETDRDREGPRVRDYTAVLFQHAAVGDFAVIDRNLARWNDRFSLAASGALVGLLELFDRTNGTSVLAELLSFSTSGGCASNALKLKLLSSFHYLNKQQVGLLSKAAGVPGSIDADEVEDFSSRPKRGVRADIVQAALTTLLHSSRASAEAIIRHVPRTRPSSYDYGERFGSSKAWCPVLQVCVRAWCAGRRVAYHDLLPREIGITKRAKALSTTSELVEFLRGLQQPAPKSLRDSRKGGKKSLRPRFSDQEREGISKGIELVRELTRPIEEAVLSREAISEAGVSDFLAAWAKHQRENVHWRAESAADSLARTVGIGCAQILLSHAPEISVDQARRLIDLASIDRILVHEKIEVLGLLARRSGLHECAGEFAKHIAEQIRRDDDIEQRGTLYADLAACLAAMSIDEAREYYRQGLAQLDQMGGESYDQIYSLLHFAGAQRGGFLKPVLAQRLMNLCQTIVRNEPQKFGWTLFARAASRSTGFPAIAKLVRWHDQDVADLSYGLPQLACFLAKAGFLDPRRAAFFLIICEDHGWWDWRTGDGVADLLDMCSGADQRSVFQAVLAKLRSAYPSGGWPSLWEGMLLAGDKHPGAMSPTDRDAITQLRIAAARKQEESNSRDYSTSPGLLTASTPSISKEEVDGILRKLIAGCEPALAGSVDHALGAISADGRLPYDFRQRFLSGLRQNCPYPKRLTLLQAICDASELDLSQSLDVLSQSVSTWLASSAHLASHAKELVERLFENKGAHLFEGQFSNLARGIRQLSDFCGDKRFVLQLVLRKVAANEVELDGDEWLQLATEQCDIASGPAGLDALELLLAGPASRIADEIGEGPLLPGQAIAGGEVEFFSDVVWHLLGEEDSYVRWAVARGLSTLVELGLVEDLGHLLRRFDKREVGALTSSGRKLSFQNAQQWLLMGVSRAAGRHGPAVAVLRPQLLELSRRCDLHIIDQLHVARTIRGLSAPGQGGELTEKLFEELNHPPHGTVVMDGYPAAAKPTTDFSFGYEFRKIEIDAVARLFNVAKATVEDTMAAEIVRLWPEATSLDSFPGRDRYDWDRNDRYELYREHIQRHALLQAATSLAKKLPVVIRSYEVDVGSPWLEWRSRFDITFDDGSWLSDRKDAVPQEAVENLLGKRVERKETLVDQEVLLHKLGLLDVPPGASIPLYGRWSSPDGVTVSIVSALTERKGALGRCRAFAKLPSHDLWLPEFWDSGYYDRRHRAENPFAPLVWAPETHSLGIDVGDEIAAEGAGGRPRLGVELTESLRLEGDVHAGDWRTDDGRLALRSQVWGSWKPASDHRGSRHHEDGEILWASPEWLAETLLALKKLLVFKVKLWKYKSSRDYDSSSGVRSVLVGLRSDSGEVQVWPARKASKEDY